MRKLLLVLVILMIPIVYGIENCKNPIEPPDLPCRLVSAWNYTPPCNSYQAEVYNTSGHNIINYTFADYGDSGFCSLTWNLSMKGSYTFIVNNGDTGEILVRQDNMQIGIIMGIGIIVALFIFLAFKLDKSHFLMRLLLIFFSIALITIIPATYIVDDVSIIFHNIIMGFITVFWLYVAAYVIYWLFQKFISIIGRK